MLRAGRLPTDADLASGLRGAVINEAAARSLFPDGPAVGRRVSPAASDDPEYWTVLGVIGDLRHGGPLSGRSENYPRVFLPLEPTEFDLSQAMMVVVRPSARAPDLGNRLREAARSIGPRVLVERVRTGNDWFGDRLVTPRRRTVLLSLLGWLGLGARARWRLRDDGIRCGTPHVRDRFADGPWCTAGSGRVDHGA